MGHLSSRIKFTHVHARTCTRFSIRHFAFHCVIKQSTRKRYNKNCRSWFFQLSCLASSRIIIIISRVTQKLPRHYSVRAENLCCKIWRTLYPLDRATRVEVRVPAVLPIFPQRKKNIDVRLCDFIVREIRRRNPRRERILRAPFTDLCVRKKWRSRLESSRSLIVINWQNVECVYTSPGAVEVSRAVPLPPVVIPLRCVHPRSFSCILRI